MKNMRRVLALLLTLTMLITMLPAGALATENGSGGGSPDNLVIEAGKVSGYVGQTVEMTVDIKNNPGIIAAELNIDYDSSKLKLVKAVDAELLGGYVASETTEKQPYYMSWMENETGVDNTKTGTLATLSFEILDGCASGDEAAVTVEVKSAQNAALQDVSFAAENGIVTVVAAPTVTYAITVDETTNGIVAADKETAAEGETVTLTVTPNEGYELDTLTVTADGAAVAVENNQFTMPAGDVTVIAVFKQIEQDDTESKLVIEAVNVTGKAGDTVEVPIEITENPGVIAFGIEVKYDADKLSLKEMPEKTDLIGGTTTYSQYVNDNPFVAIFDNSTVEANITATGTLMVMKFDIKADAEPGDTPIEVSFRSSGTPINFDMDTVPHETKNGIVTIAAPTYAITVGETTNGIVTADKETAAEGETVTLTVEPAEGYELDTVTMNGEAIEGTTFTMPAKDVTVSAAFKKIDYTVTVAGDIQNGTVTADKTTAQIGDTVTLTVTPASKYKLDTLAVTDADGVAVTVDENNQFIMPAGDVTISATFKKISTGGGGGGGGSSVSGADRAAAKEVKELIEAIGIVDEDSKSAIEAAREAYDKLTAAQKKQVNNYDELVAAEKAYAELPGKDITPVEMPYTDTEGHWAANAIQYAYDNGLMIGTTETNFAPNLATSRAMIATILYRLAGSPDVEGKVSFADVADGAWYTDAILWAEANNVVRGYGNGKFGPNDNITREQLASILYRYAAANGLNVNATADLTGFADADTIGEWAIAAMQWANAEGLITGKTGNVIDAKGNATRAEVATILMRYLENIAA